MEDVIALSLEFLKELIDKTGNLIRCAILFGSYARGENKENSDIDLLIIVDDVYIDPKGIFLPIYYEALNNLLKNEKYSKFHINTITLSAFWNMVIKGDPLIINILKVGRPILDPFGLFGSLKKLLELGEIKTTEETLNLLKNRARWNLERYNYELLKALESIYNSFLDLAQYYIGKKGKEIPPPEKVSEVLKETIKNKKEANKFSKYFDEIYQYIHEISHKRKNYVELKDLEKFYKYLISFKEFVENEI